jgi:hypothetical protein
MGITIVLLVEFSLLIFVATKLIRLLFKDEANNIIVPIPVKVVFRLVGLLNIGLCAIGAYWMVETTIHTVQRHKFDPAVGYFWVAYIAIMTVNMLLMAMLVFTAFKLLKLTKNSVLAYCAYVGTFLLYGLLNGGLWLLPDPMGRSIGAATGIANVGLAPYEFLFVMPDAYPIASAVLVFIVHRRLTRMNPEPSFAQ